MTLKELGEKLQFTASFISSYVQDQFAKNEALQVGWALIVWVCFFTGLLWWVGVVS